MKRRGVSLIEMLVAMGMSSMLTANARNRRQEAFEQVKNDLTAELTNAVKWAEDVSYASDQITAGETVYRMDNGHVTRNGSALNSNEVRVTRFEVTEYGPGEDNLSLNIQIDLEDAMNNSVKDTIKIAASKRLTTFEE